MKATITRTGGFAGLTVRKEVDLSHSDLAKLREKCGAGLQPGQPDQFSYDVTVNGETFTVRGEDAEPLLGSLLHGA